MNIWNVVDGSGFVNGHDLFGRDEFFYAIPKIQIRIAGAVKRAYSYCRQRDSYRMLFEEWYF